MPDTIPAFGTALLLATLLSSAFTFFLALGSTAHRPHWLQAARNAGYATVALSTSAVLLLAYAFVSHDFRISYVTRYSDRSMPLGYLLTALWGGQDGSLLWWLFLMAAFTGVALLWLRTHYQQLAPYVIAVLMSVIMFFCVVMIFGADPFTTHVTGARADGAGLNPLLQNIYMILHPPALYVGFVGCAVPYAIAMGALWAGKLDGNWVLAARKWMLFAWFFLTLGNALGMIWAYVELGWGGFWGWDPVENASLLPWLTATAYLHTSLVQERRSLFRVVNIVLVSLTFFLTIFGTFLTRSGIVASVHAFAKSNLGYYFLGYMAVIIVVSIGLALRARADNPRFFKGSGVPPTLVSKESALLAGAILLVGATLFVAVATLFPLISEGLDLGSVTLGPPFYNLWMTPIGIALLVLMGAAPMLGWRKSGARVTKMLLAPGVCAGVVALVHLLIGEQLDLPAVVASAPISATKTAQILASVHSVSPVLFTSLLAFNIAVLVQEVVRATVARQKSLGAGLLNSLMGVVRASPRRYGAYVSHFGVLLLILGFTGQFWTSKAETSLLPGNSYVVSGYKVQYVGPRVEVDVAKQMQFGDFAITDRHGQPRGILSPAKFFYRSHPDQPTTEIDVLHSFRDDVYLVLGGISPDGRASLLIHINPLVSWIWLGIAIVLLGTVLVLVPSTSVAKLEPDAVVKPTHVAEVSS